MYTILVVLLVLVSIALMGLIMLQQGKGADAGAAFGTGVSGTMFGSHGGGTFLSHVTAGLATAFFVITLALAYLANHQRVVSNSVVDRVHATQTQKAVTPVAPAPVKPAMQTGAPQTAASAKAPTTGAAATHEKKPAASADKRGEDKSAQATKTGK
ncbi:MAG TPA: preprotein translocase subunit SecG [Nevskiaceae bacterium]|nr:preprotein translocase subunit SecG [Nevskiaceae bacterium]